MDQREGLEYLKHLQALLEQACEHFQVIYIAPNVSFPTLSNQR